MVTEEDIEPLVQVVFTVRAFVFRFGHADMGFTITTATEYNGKWIL